MSDVMGTFRIELEIENPALPGMRRALSGVLVDTGAELRSGYRSRRRALGGRGAPVRVRYTHRGRSPIRRTG